MVENFNNTLAKILSKIMPKTAYANWDAYIAPATFAHNTSISTTLQEIPFYLMFSRDPRLPQDLMFNLPVNNLGATHLAERLKSAFESAQASLEKNHERWKKQFNEKRKPSDIRVNDIVLLEYEIREKGYPDKFQPCFKGPYKVVARIGELNAIIEHLKPESGKKVVELVSVRKLQPYHRNHQLEAEKEVSSQAVNENTQEQQNQSEEINVIEMRSRVDEPKASHTQEAEPQQELVLETQDVGLQEENQQQEQAQVVEKNMQHIKEQKKKEPVVKLRRSPRLHKEYPPHDPSATASILYIEHEKGKGE